MRDCWRVLQFVLWTTSTMCGVDQSPASPGAENLELQLRSESMGINGPQAFTVLMVNRSDHDVRLPKPSLECGDVRRGTVGLRVLKPGAAGPGHGCSEESFYQPILDRVKEWKILRPGESLILMSEPTLDQYAGIYDYWAYYSPPGMPKADEDVLQKAGIYFPKSNLESTHVRFVKKKR